MKPLATIERVRECLDYNHETGVFIWKRREGDSKAIKIWNTRFAGKQTGYKANIHGFFCIQITIDNKRYRAHRVAWAHVHGEWPETEIDHINLNPCDNRICNLRLADRSQNECNKKARIDNALGVKGVHFDKSRKKYMVQLKFKNKVVKKRVPTLEEATMLYASLVEKYHGEFGRTA